MIVEERIYTIQIGKLAEYVGRYEKEGLAIQVPILGRLVGYFTTDIGELNQVVHLWAYKDLNERAERRKSLWANEAWCNYIKHGGNLVLKQENKILIPAPFSPWANDDPSLDMAR
ncbi:MAG: NIPSNAP family protein [Rhizobiaceae bacterium]|nr:NIPSNAP family protein [Rhizobiaceae bacterium]MBL4731918.1 NIPSNAP family protein [Rhizobiaceae bacterium]